MSTVARTEVPAEFRNQEPLMTERQETYLRDLIDGRVMTEEERAEALRLLNEGPRLTRRQASAWIDKALTLPKATSKFAHLKESLPDVPEGRYAIDIDDTVKFYRVDRPTEGRWAGFVFLKVQASDDYHPIRNTETKKRVLQAIMDAGPAEAARRYGIELGSCGVCGRTLTDEISRAYGIGPICRERTGW